MKIEDFTGVDYRNQQLHKPYKSGEYVFATDYIMAARRKIVEGDDYQDCPNSFSYIYSDIFRDFENRKFEPFSPALEISTETCDVCDGFGSGKQLCHFCEGSKIHECQCGNSHDCNSCDAKGYIVNVFANCIQCGGKGVVDQAKAITIDGYIVRGRTAKAVFHENTVLISKETIKKSASTHLNVFFICGEFQGVFKTEIKKEIKQ